MRSGLFSSAIVVLAASMSASAATVAQYNFDSLLSPTGPVIADISGNGHDITYSTGSGPVSLSSDDPFGQSGNSSAVVQYNTGVAANASTINLNNGGSNKYTLEGWINPSAYDDDYIVHMQGTDAGNTFIANLIMTSAGKAYARLYNGGPAVSAVASADSLVLNSWNYLAVVYDGNWLHLYMKNANHPTLDEVGTLEVGVALPTTITGSVSIAAEGGNHPAKFDDIRISDTALSVNELGYQQSFTVPEPASMALLAMGGLLLVRRKRV